MKKKIISPFFVVSPKSYLLSAELIKLAKIIDEIAGGIDNTIFFSVPTIDLTVIAGLTKNVVVTAQTSDGNGLGIGMGRNLIENLKFHGVGATFLNHKESQMKFRDLVFAIKKAKENKIISIVCADTVEEAQLLARLSPDIILCEPYELIGTGITSKEEYIKETINAVKEINQDIFVMEGAGITCGKDVKRLMSLGADGTGISSIISKVDDKKQLLEELISNLVNGSDTEVEYDIS